MDKALHYELLFRGLRDKYGEAQVIPMFNYHGLGHAFDGGPKSGNFNHAGRPGLVGGSAPSKGANKGQQEENQKQMEYINNIVQEIDFTKDNILPGISKEDAEMLGVEPKPYLLKKSIIDRNKISHPDISEEKAKEILAQALYQRGQIIQEAAENKGHYFHFAKFVEGYNYLVLVDFTATKQYNEIVHYHIMRQKNFMNLIRKSVQAGKRIYK